MMKKTFCLIFVFVLLAAAFPFSAFAYDPLPVVYVGGVGMVPGDYLAVGKSVPQKTVPEGCGFVYVSNSSLVMNNYSYEGLGYVYEEKDDYSTKKRSAAIYSEKTLNIVLYGYNSLIEAKNYTRSHAIFSQKAVNISGNGTLYLKANYPLFAEETIKIQYAYLNVYSDYFYGICSATDRVVTSDAALRIRGTRGIHTPTDEKNIEFHNSHVDIDVTEQGIFSSGAVVINDSYLKSISNNPEFFNEYFSIYSLTGVVNHTNVVSKASTNAYGNNSVMFKAENMTTYHYVEFSRQNKLKYIEVVDILPPESTCFPDFEGKAESSYTSILSVSWFEVRENEEDYLMKKNDRFVNGRKYRLNVAVIAGDSYEFDDVSTSAYLGNDLVSNYSNNSNLKIRIIEKEYTASNNPANYTVTIGNISLKDGDYLSKGASSTTTSKPDDNYAYYKNGVLYFQNFSDRKAEVVFNEGLLIIKSYGSNVIYSLRDSFDKDGNEHNVYINGNGLLDIIGYNSSSATSCAVNINGELTIADGYVYVDDYTYCCLDVKYLIMNGGELFCSSSQAGVFAGETEIRIFDGVFNAFDGGGWWQFINDNVIIETGTVYVSNDGKNSFETASKWDGETPLKTYDAVWIVAEEDDSSDEPTPTPDQTPDYLLGDVNNDGTVDTTDYLKVKAHFFKTSILEGKAFKAGDVTKDEVIDATDYLRIKGHFLGNYNIHE